jgi:dipeptidyl aminopeptidase/acylaminoacyl peptidase
MVGLRLVWPAIVGAQSEPVRVADLIGLSLFGSDAHSGGLTDVHVLSPDGRHVAVVVQRGNLADNSVEYRLLVLATARLPAAVVDTVVSLASTSNDPAISQLHWLDDSRRIEFLGARAGELAQVYLVDVATHTLTARTRSAAGVTAFETGPAGEPIIYQERGTADTSAFAAMRAHGFVVAPDVWPSEVIQGDWLAVRRLAGSPRGYRIVRHGSDAPLPLPASTSPFGACEINHQYGPPVSPSGDGVVLACTLPQPPAKWASYRNQRYRMFADQFAMYGQLMVLLDLETGQARLLLDAPLMPQAETNFVWAPDGRSVVVSTALLPLTGPDSPQRMTQRQVAEIDVRTGLVTIVTPRDSLVVQRWDARTGSVEFARERLWFNVRDVTPRVFFRKTAHGWSGPTSAAPAAMPSLVIDQGPNTPPRLAVVDPKTHARQAELDPNPGLLAARRFGRVEVFHWTTKLGNEFAGGLYYPPDFQPGRRYPLVIQTHGYDSTTFAPDGPFTTGEAAQPLAGAGILVLQAGTQVRGDLDQGFDTPAEGPTTQDAIEGAIDALDRRRLIDRGKTALQGFSRTCYAVLYFLTHSSYPVSAADLTDGVDFSYLQYVLYGGGRSDERINGGKPWGAAQAQWLQRAPGFRLDRVQTPLRFTALGPYAVLEEWEPYAGLLLQGKPAELVYIPEGSHILVKPWERMTSQQGAVDWYRFWLQGYEDPDPAKGEQYTRWRKLRTQRDSSLASTSR